MKHSVIIFDFDGVIVDANDHLYHWHQLLFPSITRDQHRDLSIGNYWETLAQFGLERVVKTEEERAQEYATFLHERSRAGLYEGVVGLLRLLRAEGARLFINTSSDVESCRANLAHHGVLDLFEQVLGKEVSESKIEKFDMIVRAAEVLPSEALFITDTLGDIFEANKAGVPTIAVTYGLHGREQLCFGETVAIVDSVDELRKNLFGE